MGFIIYYIYYIYSWFSRVYGNLMQFQDACNMFAGPISSQEYGIGMEPKKDHCFLVVSILV